MGDDQRRLIQLLDDVRHRKSLARTGDAKKGLKLVSFLETFDQLFDRLWLIPLRLVIGHQLKQFIFHK